MEKQYKKLKQLYSNQTKPRYIKPYYEALRRKYNWTYDTQWIRDRKVEDLLITVLFYMLPDFKQKRTRER